MLKYQPTSFDELYVPNKENLLNFVSSCHNSQNYNIAIVGPSNSCKGNICDLIIKDFLSHPSRRDIHKDKIIFRLQTCGEKHISNMEILDIFCKTNVNSNKLVYIDQFDMWGDTNQQIIKHYIDKYSLSKNDVYNANNVNIENNDNDETSRNSNRVFFLVKCSMLEHIKDIIKSRLHVHCVEKLNATHHRDIIYHISKDIIELDNHVVNYILKQKVSVNSLCSLITRLYITQEETRQNSCHETESKNSNMIEINRIKQLHSVVDFDIFHRYILDLQFGKFSDAIDKLLSLYSDGFDISDIYFYFYQYLSTVIEEEKIVSEYIYKVLERLCFYMHEVYHGHTKCFILYILTLDLYEIINPTEPLNTLLIKKDKEN
jgi:hypothetical protein